MSVIYVIEKEYFGSWMPASLTYDTKDAARKKFDEHKPPKRLVKIETTIVEETHHD